MARSPRTVLLTLIAAGALSAEAVAELQPGGTVTVRMYNVAGVALSAESVAEVAAGALLLDAGIEAVWRRCRTPTGPMSRSSDACEDALQPREIVIRMVRAPRTFGYAEALGYSHVDVSAQRGTLATVFTDRVHTLAWEIKMAEGELLGRAVAHEIGHLLLGTISHSSTGLMRGHWSVRGQKADWQFTGEESAHMQLGLAARGPVDLVAALHRGKTPAPDDDTR